MGEAMSTKRVKDSLKEYGLEPDSVVSSLVDEEDQAVDEPRRSRRPGPSPRTFQSYRSRGLDRELRFRLTRVLAFCPRPGRTF